MQLPHTFGRYTLQEKLAQGGMAEVYRARYNGEQGFVKTVAIKRILPSWSDDPHFVAMLIDEANALTYLQHQNIVQVYELGKDGDAYFIAMEFVAGMDCRTLLRRCALQQTPLSEPQALYVIAEVLKGLSFAHGQTDAQHRPLGIVHRDISPQNILLSFHGEVKIADFGIAKGSHRHRNTHAAQVKGKYAYMAPEQAAGGPVDARADVFAVGVVLYELLTGTQCFDGSNDLAVLEKVKQGTLPQGWERQFHPVVRAILTRALARAPADRYPTAQAFLEDVTRYIFSHQLLVHGYEWAEFLRTLCPDRIHAPVEESARAATAAYSVHGAHQAQEERWRGWSILLRQGRRALLTGSAMGCVLMATVAHGDRTAIAMRAPSPPVITNEPVSVSAAPVSLRAPDVGAKQSSETHEIVALRPTVTPPARGSLYVQARPWGEVTVPGVVASREAPIGMPVAAGTYTVRVVHRASGAQLANKVTVRSGTRTTCFATFGEKPSMRCR